MTAATIIGVPAGPRALGRSALVAALVGASALALAGCATSQRAFDSRNAAFRAAHQAAPVLQLQADSDSSQPTSIFADPSRYPGVRLQWITGASHFDNLDQPAQVANAINRFLADARP